MKSHWLKTMVVVFGVAAAVCLAAFLLADRGCPLPSPLPESDAPPTSTRQPDKLLIGYIPIADAAQIYVAAEKGYFKEHNLNVKFVKFAGGAPIIEALNAKSLQLGLTGTVPLLLAASRGVDIVAISGGSVQDKDHAYQALVVPTGSGVTSGSHLQGKVVAINVPKSIDHLFSIAYLRKIHVDPKSVRFISIPFPKMENVLASGQVDAASMIEPFLTAALKSGKYRTISHHIVEVQPRFEMTTYVARRKWMTDNAGVLGRFQKALQQATIFLRTAPENDLRGVILRYARVPPGAGESMTLPSFGQSLSKRGLLATGVLLKDAGFISRAPDPAQFVHAQVLGP